MLYINKLVIGICLLGVALAGNSFDWNDCGSQQLQIQHLDISPAPIVLPGKLAISVVASFGRNINGTIKTKITMNKLLSGGTKIEVPCYNLKMNGDVMRIGSCEFNDTCKELIVQHSECGKKFSKFADCACPLTLKTLTIDVDKVELDLSNLKRREIFMAVGDYELKIETQDFSGPIGCVMVKFSITQNYFAKKDKGNKENGGFFFN